MNRLRDWPVRIDALVNECRRTPFAWGVHDCCQFARRFIQAQTGEDPAAFWGLAPYATATQAKAELARLGGLAALPLHAGLREVPVRFAQRGDIVLVRQGRRRALAGCMGAEIAAPSKAGLESLPIGVAINAWRI